MTYRSHSRGPPRFPAPLHLRLFSPLDRDRRFDSPALSGRHSRPSWRMMRPVSRGNFRHSLVDGDTCRKTPISRSALDKIPMPGHLFEDNPFDEGTTGRGTDTPGYHPEKPAGTTHSSRSDLSPREQLERQAEFHSSTQDEA